MHGPRQRPVKRIAILGLMLGAATSVAAPDACDATRGVRVVVAVDYDQRPGNADLNAVKLVVTHPSTIGLPAEAVRDRVKTLGTTGDVRAVPGVFGTPAAPQLNVVLASFGDALGETGDGIAPGDAVDVHFVCAGTTRPTEADLGCRVESANDILSNPIAATCAARVVP
jgi:hypothetical protein